MRSSVARAPSRPLNGLALSRGFAATEGVIAVREGLMGYGLEAYLMTYEADLDVFGCKDGELLDEVLDATQRIRAEYDTQFDVAGTGRIPHAQALREIFDGALTRPDDCDSIYGWAFKIYCGSLGEFLDNNPFMPSRSAWYDALDAVLESGGVPATLRFQKLIGNTPEACPIPIPTSQEWPSIGHWTHADIDGAREALGALATRAEDPFSRRAFRVVYEEWFQLAAERPESQIVAFYG